MARAPFRFLYRRVRPLPRQIAPVLSAVAAQEADRLKAVQIDADGNPAAVTRYGVLSLPTLLLFRDGEPVKQIVAGGGAD